MPELNGCAERVRSSAIWTSWREATFLVEAVVEDPDHKGPLLAELAAHTGPDEILATTTSSLSIADLAVASGHPDRFVGLHVFNPVPRMELIELAFGPETRDDVRAARAGAVPGPRQDRRSRSPTRPGFVVNRLLFPYLFSAVELHGRDRHGAGGGGPCMTLGAGMPMGPIALLDFVGLDVSQAIGEDDRRRGPGPPDRAGRRAGALGRKTRRGFYDYD